MPRVRVPVREPGPDPAQPDGTSDSPVISTDAPRDAKEFLDAPPSVTCDPGLCMAAGGTCQSATGHCRIDHPTNGGVTCPPGHFCDISCVGTNDSCKSDGVDCTNAVGCTITCGMGGAMDASCSDGPVRCPLLGPCKVTCNGELACRHEPVICGGGPCDVRCLGINACGDRGVDCTTSVMCKAVCKGTNACRNGGVACGPSSCNVECNGDNACQNLPTTCAVQPATCAFHCCGNAACQNNPLCPTCTRDAVCPP